jgi:hypothetical protein
MSAGRHGPGNLDGSGMTGRERSGIRILSESDAVDRIVDSVRAARAGEAPFVLVLGAGFSRGLVPTTREVVEEALPLWLHARRTEASFASQRVLSPERRRTLAVDFWRRFVDDNRHCGLHLEFDDRGLPKDAPAAYSAAFDNAFRGALATPARARESPPPNQRTPKGIGPRQLPPRTESVSARPVRLGALRARRLLAAADHRRHDAESRGAIIGASIYRVVRRES